MTAKHRIVPNLYQDSVALMVISSKLLAIEGLEAASVVMATPTNLENLVEAGLGEGLDTKPSDLIVAVAGTDDACDAALTLADELLAEKPPSEGGNVVEQPVTSIQMATVRNPGLNFALISVPGPYAAAEATKAIRLGMSVMVFSDNVPVADELAMKRLADARGLMVMGPDCGTAIVNGLPLGFANVVRRGSIGVVGASGTGMQEVTARIHNLGAGVSQALGTGGHDLSHDIGGISMLHGLRSLDADPATAVIVLVSKPPAERVAAAVLDEARRIATPVVVIFLGEDPEAFSDELVHGAATLAGAADLAVALAHHEAPPESEAILTPEARDRLDAAALRIAVGRQFVRGIFCGGTFCFEAQLLCQRQGIVSSSNAPVAGNRALDDIRVSTGHTIVDMGDDEFTQGRPHPMIDPTLRNERIANEAADASTAVLLLDVVLGYGSAADPLGGLLDVLHRVSRSAGAAGGHIAVIAHVCGTDADPQNRGEIIAKLESAGAMVASTNAEAALWAAYVVNRLAAR